MASTKTQKAGRAHGAYGIRQVDPRRVDAFLCLTCGRAWVEDITPAGRCPWEHLHTPGQSLRSNHRNR